MALSFPYALDFLAKCLTGDRVSLDLRRNDEMSGSGDGRFWAAELSRPLWTAQINLHAKQAAHAREINAKVWALDGSSKTFLFGDPAYKGPASGMTTGLGSVTVSSIRADRGAISLSGLPPGFVASAGDYLSINFGTGRVYFGALAEGGTANGSGVLASREIRPYLPMTITTGATVELVRPRFKAIIPPGGFTPFANFRGRWGDSASIQVLQKP